MNARRLKEDNNVQNVVWFGSYGVNEDGTAKFYNVDDKHDNYSTGTTSVKDSLTQRLSVLKKELWYDYSYGMPLTEKGSSKISLDSYILGEVSSHSDVSSILSFSSVISGNVYSCEIKIQSVYGEIIVTI